MNNIVLIVLCLLLSTYCILEERRERFTRAVVFKGLASLCFVILGLTSSNGTYPARMITTGLVLGMIADILLVLGCALVVLALGLLLAWTFIWFIGGAIPGLIRGVSALRRKWCYKEVEVR